LGELLLLDLTLQLAALALLRVNLSLEGSDTVREATQLLGLLLEGRCLLFKVLLKLLLRLFLFSRKSGKLRGAS